jgi:hypothetical protein
MVKGLTNYLVWYLLLFLVRPHDRVLVKEMKADWHSCLDNKIGFKVIFFNYMLLEPVLLMNFTNIRFIYFWKLTKLAHTQAYMYIFSF